MPLNRNRDRAWETSASAVELKFAEPRRLMDAERSVLAFMPFPRARGLHVQALGIRIGLCLRLRIVCPCT